MRADVASVAKRGSSVTGALARPNRRLSFCVEPQAAIIKRHPTSKTRTHHAVMGGFARSFRPPVLVRILYQTDVVVARIVRHLVARPRRFLEQLVLAVELDFRHDQPGVVALEHVHFPEVVGVLHVVTDFFDQRPRAELIEQLFGIVRRDGIFIFAPPHAQRRALDVEEGLRALHPHADRRALAAAQIPLPQAHSRHRDRAPTVVHHQEFAFDLGRHLACFLIPRVRGGPHCTPAPSHGRRGPLKISSRRRLYEWLRTQRLAPSGQPLKLPMRRLLCRFLLPRIHNSSRPNSSKELRIPARLPALTPNRPRNRLRLCIRAWTLAVSSARRIKTPPATLDSSYGLPRRAALRYGGRPMKAIVMTAPGAAAVLRLQEDPTPVFTSDRELLVRLTAAGITPLATKLRARGT